MNSLLYRRDNLLLMLITHKDSECDESHAHSKKKKVRGVT